MDYIAAGFDPAAFGRLTPRLYQLHMNGAIKRIERDADLRNHQAYNTAALIGAAMAGKLPKFDEAFRKGIQKGVPQPPEVVEANLMALARAWGVKA